MIFLLLGFGTFWYWSVCAVLSLLFIWELELEKPWLVTSELAAFALLTAAFTNFNPFKWLVAHPYLTLIYAAGWFVAGTLWATTKWWFFVAKTARRYQQVRTTWLANKANRGVVPPLEAPPQYTQSTNTSRGVETDEHVLWRNWRGTVDEALGCYPDELPPKVVKNKGRIMMWMCWWPWSATWTLLNDPVRRVFQEIYERIASTLQRISNSMFKFDELKSSE